MPQVSYDSRTLLVDNRRLLMLSGAIHYPRSTPSTWPALMKRSREAGLNTIETYVFWNLHERHRGVYDFSGRLDLPQFCRLAQEHGLNVILRIGPYICAETNFGGLPPWLRDLPGVQMRTFNQPFMEHMGRWVRDLCGILRPYFAPQGGPIILAQLENEYNNVAKNYAGAGQQYLQWCVQLGREIDVNVPLVMCCGASEGAIETMNGFYVHRLLDEHRAAHPDQPPIWTENWPAWYDTFGYSRHFRTPENVAYAVARFFAAGGAGVNYYMWHGGTNFGREAMYLQTTSYDFNGGLDEFGCITTKGRHLARLHRLLQDHVDLLTTGKPAERLPLAENQGAYVYGTAPDRSVVFLCNDDAEHPASVSFGGESFTLAPFSVILLVNGRVAMDTSRIEASSVAQRERKPIRAAIAVDWWEEPMPTSWPVDLRSETISRKPLEQLQFTHDRTDYCWYTTTLNVMGKVGTGTLTLARAADVVHVFVDGKRVATTPTPLMENRGPVDSDSFKQTFQLKLSPGRHELSLFCCAMGMIKGDWMLGMTNMANERKGLWGEVLWNGKPVPGPWRIQPGTVGERCEVWGAAGAMVIWKAAKPSSRDKALRWWRLRFKRPAATDGLVADLQGMTKGLAWLNGRCIGRYWLAPAAGRNPISPGAPIEVAGMVGEPTQRFYHLPLEWLRDQNTLVLLEEQAGDARQIRLCNWALSKGRKTTGKR